MLAVGHDWLRHRTTELIQGLIQAQRPDGAWPYLLDKPESGACNKGTPALAYHLNKAQLLIPELAAEIECAVARALEWCEANMEMDPGSSAYGGIAAENDE